MLLVFIDAPRSFGRDRFLAGGEPESADDAPAITSRAWQVELKKPVDLTPTFTLVYCHLPTYSTPISAYSPLESGDYIAIPDGAGKSEPWPARPPPTCSQLIPDTL